MPKEKRKEKLKILESLKQLENEEIDLEEEEEGEEIINFEEEGEKSYEPVQIDPEEEKEMDKFMFGNIGNLILSKFKELPKTKEKDDDKLPLKVERAYKKLGLLMSEYSGGKLPKAFYIIPKISNWEDVLACMNVSKWTNQAFVPTTVIFANSNVSQKFYNLVLLPKLRTQIFEEKKLNFHIYLALKKALYRPDSFFKGIIIPLCESGTLTSREAIIIGSVLQKCSIPMIHSSAALYKLCLLEYSAQTSYFIKVLIEKKYSLPTKVIETLITYFYSFIKDDRVLPVLFHQALFSFIQIYKKEFKKENIIQFKELIKKHVHPKMTPEIKKELKF